MTDTFISTVRPKIEELLREKRLRDALVLLRSMSEQYRTRGISETLMKIEETYMAMLHYLSLGASDPERNTLYSSLVTDTYRVLDRLTRHVSSQSTPTLYYDALRYRRQQRGNLSSFRDTMRYYADAVADTSIFNLVNADTSASTSSRLGREKAEKEIFDYVWTVYPLDGEDAATVAEALRDDTLPGDFHALLVSALMLGELEFHDDERMCRLADVVERGHLPLSLRALTGLVLGLYKYRGRPVSKRLADRLEALKEMPQWNKYINLLQLELIRAIDTERITKKMQSEVIPEMMKHSSNIFGKLKDGKSDEDVESMEENPEWRNILEDSSLKKRLEELNELQMDGSDVMMSTFGHLKSHPFFRDVAHWFTPFSLDRSELKSVRSFGDSSFAAIISGAPMLCDSDKYSLFFALESVPDSQKQMMMSQLSAQSAHLAELAAAGENAVSSPRMILNSYVHDIYRFYKLYRRKGEFYDPFASPSNLWNVALLSESFNDEESMLLIAELYFKYHMYAQALEGFNRYLELAPPSAQVFQKIGYCHERMAEYQAALENYRQSELFNADSEWTIRRLAAVSKLTGDTKSAIDYYSRLAEMLPEDISVALNLGNTLALDGRYSDAIAQYYKVTFLDEGSPKPWRPLAWCLFMTGEFDKSESYYKRILADNPVADDYLNMGHLELARGNMGAALANYKQAISSGDGSYDTFVKKMAADSPALAAVGVDPAQLPIVSDAVYYSNL